MNKLATVHILVRQNFEYSSKFLDEQITNGSWTCMRISEAFLSQFPCFALKYIEEGVKACLAACLSKFGAFEENKSAFLIFYLLVSPPCLV